MGWLTVIWLDDLWTVAWYFIARQDVPQMEPAAWVINEESVNEFEFNSKLFNDEYIYH